MSKLQAYVTADGTFGVGDFLVFDESKLTSAQWEVVDMIGDNDRYEYIRAIIEGDSETIQELEEYSSR